MEKTIEKARELLLNQDEPSFGLDIPCMKFGKNIIFDTFQNYAKITGTSGGVFKQIKDGCTIIKGDIHIILTHSRSSVLNYRVSPIADTGNKRMNWTMAHEVGHIMLGHLKDDEEEERQANNFASELLMPELVMLELKRGLGRKLGVHEVSRLFDVSQNAALNRISQMERRSRFSAYLKHEMMKKYKSLIDDYIEKNKEKLCQTITI